MSERDNGGPAFPRTWSDGSNGEYWNASEVGMSLSDWFAGQNAASIIGAIANSGKSTAREDAAKIAQSSYILADAMIAERNK